MGSGFYDTTASATRSAVRSSTGASAFKYEEAIKKGTAKAELHPSLDLRKKPRRECRDNADNPVSVPIAVMVDCTGSMGHFAQLIIDSLHKVVPAIRDRGMVKYPALCFGAIGDAYYDRAPIQIGEFESDDKLAEGHLENLWRGGCGGGGNNHESYSLTMWAMANLVETDHWDKRGQKGFLFIIEDEPLDPFTPKQHIKDHIGLDVPDDVPVGQTAQKLMERWNVMILRPNAGHYYSSKEAQESWTDVFPEQNVVKVPDWQDLVAMIAGSVSVMSGMSATDTIDAVTSSGLKVDDTTRTALARLEESTSIVAAIDDLASSGPGTGVRF